MVDAASDPLRPGRFLRNVWHSVSYAGIEVPEDPRDAAGASCTTG